MSEDLDVAGYVNGRVDGLRTELNSRLDKLGGEIATERADRRAAVDELARDINEMSTSRLRSASTWMKAIIIAGVTAVIGGCITLIVFYTEAASHLTGGTH